MQVPDVAAYVATALAAAGALPQVMRLRSTGDIAGVSLTGAAIGVASETAWVAYAVQGRLWSAVTMPALMVPANVVLSIAIVRAGAAPARAITTTLTWSAALATATVIGGWSTLGLLLAFAYAAQVAPSVGAAYTTMTPSGIAPGRWGALLAECALRGWYGFARADLAICAFAVVGACSAVAILWRCFVRSGRRSLRPEPSRHRASGARRVPVGSG